MTPILALLIGLLAISGIGLIVLVLLHSGKGTDICLSQTLNVPFHKAAV